MRFLHTADLHLGKRVYQFSMIKDQEYILDQILSIALTSKADGIFISGDVYDKPTPSEEAVMLLDSFLNRCTQEGLLVFIISGNHDSSRRLAFGSKMMAAEGIYIAPAFDGTLAPLTFEDAFGEINIYLLPFIKPAQVRHYFPDQKGDGSYQWALETVINSIPLDPLKRNVLLAHQFVLGGMTSESEEVSIGGLDQIAAQTFAPFDYVALGHLHRPQWIDMEKVRYSGSPLKYSFSEVSHQKGVGLIDFEQKGKVTHTQVPLVPQYDMRQLKGSFDTLINQSTPADQQDYLRIILTDEEDVPNAFGRLAFVYPKLMQLNYDNKRTRQILQVNLAGENPMGKSPVKLFEQLYCQQMGTELKENQSQYISRAVNSIWREEE